LGEQDTIPPRFRRAIGIECQTAKNKGGRGCGSQGHHKAGLTSVSGFLRACCPSLPGTLPGFESGEESSRAHVLWHPYTCRRLMASVLVFFLFRPLPRCRFSKKTNIPSNPLDSRCLWGFRPTLPLGSSVSSQIWTRTSGLKVCSVQHDLDADWTDLITSAYAEDGRGSSIVLLDGNMGRLDPPSVPAQPAGRQDGVTREHASV
jgi:hypothetical protein